MIKGHQACSSISHKGRQYSASPYASSYMKYMQLMYDEDKNQTTRYILIVNELLLSIEYFEFDVLNFLCWIVGLSAHWFLPD